MAVLRLSCVPQPARAAAVQQICLAPPSLAGREAVSPRPSSSQQLPEQAAGVLRLSCVQQPARAAAVQDQLCCVPLLGRVGEAFSQSWAALLSAKALAPGPSLLVTAALFWEGATLFHVASVVGLSLHREVVAGLIWGPPFSIQQEQVGEHVWEPPRPRPVGEHVWEPRRAGVLQAPCVELRQERGEVPSAWHQQERAEAHFSSFQGEQAGEHHFSRPAEPLPISRTQRVQREASWMTA